MDEMKINGKIMKSLISKAISRFLRKKCNMPIIVQLNDFSIRIENGKVVVQTDIFAEMDQNDLNVLIDKLI